MTDKKLLEDVKEYYGEILSSSNDLKTSACCPIDAMPKYLQPLLKNIAPEVQDKFYGCGSPIPLAIEGCTVLDLGCGTGRDCFLASQLVGKNGKVIGIDMTQNQLDVANASLAFHKEKTGLDNVSFIKSYIEDLSQIKTASVDVVISNCVINLSPNKDAVFAEIFRVLKQGGELYLSDIFADRRIEKSLVEDPVIRGECLGGAMYLQDFRRMLAKHGCPDYRTLSSSVLTVDDDAILAKTGNIIFYSNTVRAIKCELEDICENYGHSITYNGGIKYAEHKFMLDDHHLFEKGLPYPVCGNSYNMIAQTRFAKYFSLSGNFKTHYGEFDCTPSAGQNTSNAADCC